MLTLNFFPLEMAASNIGALYLEKGPEKQVHLATFQFHVETALVQQAQNKQTTAWSAISVHVHEHLFCLHSQLCVWWVQTFHGKSLWKETQAQRTHIDYEPV